MTDTQEIEMPAFGTLAKSTRFAERLLSFVRCGTHTVVVTFGNETENLEGFGVLLQRAKTCKSISATSEIKDNVHKITLVTVVA